MKKCKFYSEYDSGQHDFGVCHYDEYKSKGFPMICTHKDNEDNCTCFEPIKENKNESKNMKKCKFYAETARRGKCANKECLLENCYFTDSFNSCECFEPVRCEEESSPYRLNSTEVNVFSKLFKDYIKDENKLERLVETFESYLSNASKGPANAEGKCSDEDTLYRVMKERIEDKEEPEVVKRFKKNLDQMMRIKISKLIGDIKDYKFVNHARVIDNCLGNFIVIDCTNDKVYTYSYAEYSWEKLPRESNRLTFQSDKVETIKLMPDNGIDPRTLTIQNCDKIILKPKSLEVEVKIEKDNFDDFDFIEINGHKFKKV